MADLAKEAFDAVQAALLESQCDPKEAVRQALRAVAQFAAAEDVVTEGTFDGHRDWIGLCEAAWKDHPSVE